eukprot:2433019-Pleurochrysis_carterae.AAC.2
MQGPTGFPFFPTHRPTDPPQTLKRAQARVSTRKNERNSLCDPLPPSAPTDANALSAAEDSGSDHEAAPSAASAPPASPTGDISMLSSAIDSASKGPTSPQSEAWQQWSTEQLASLVLAQIPRFRTQACLEGAQARGSLAPSCPRSACAIS